MACMSKQCKLFVKTRVPPRWLYKARVFLFVYLKMYGMTKGTSAVERMPTLQHVCSMQLVFFVMKMRCIK